MVVAVTVVLTVNVVTDDEVAVVAVGKRFVPAVGTVAMISFMRCARVSAGAGFDRNAGIDHVLIDMSCMHIVQMPVMKIVDVRAVLDSPMAAVLTVFMSMIAVRDVLAHNASFSRMNGCARSSRSGCMSCITRAYGGCSCPRSLADCPRSLKT
jgi:hypothetical protein